MIIDCVFKAFPINLTVYTLIGHFIRFTCVELLYSAQLTNTFLTLYISTMTTTRWDRSNLTHESCAMRTKTRINKQDNVS